MARNNTMGTFEVTVGFPGGEEVLALVDTGATFTKLPSDLLARHGVRPLFETDVELANGEVVQRSVGYIDVEIQGRRAPVPVAFGKVRERPLLGATALEILGFSADARNQRLVPTPALELLMIRRAAAATLS